VERLIEERLHVSLFNNPTSIHYSDAISNLCDHTQIMRNEQDRGFGFTHQFSHQP